MSSSRSVRPPALTTSTDRPRRASRSLQRPTWSSSDRPGSKSMRRSISLEGPAEPLATEPNTRTFDAPCAAAILTISSLRVRRPSSVGTATSSAACPAVTTTIVEGNGRPARVPNSPKAGSRCRTGMQAVEFFRPEMTAVARSGPHWRVSSRFDVARVWHAGPQNRCRD